MEQTTWADGISVGIVTSSIARLIVEHLIVGL